MQPILDIKLIILLERGYQNFRSKKNEITKKIKIKTDFEVDYENMIVNQNFD
jgi:hypothetical protein